MNNPRLLLLFGFLFIAISIGIYHGLDYEKKIIATRQQEINKQLDFEFVKTLKIQLHYHNTPRELHIYRDKHTGHSYMFYYGVGGVSISRYFEKD